MRLIWVVGEQRGFVWLERVVDLLFLGAEAQNVPGTHRAAGERKTGEVFESHLGANVARLASGSKQPEGIAPPGSGPAINWIAVNPPECYSVASSMADALMEDAQRPEKPDRPDFRALTLENAEAVAVEHGWPRYRGEQIWRWVHQHGVRRFDEMTNLGRDTQRTLAEHAALGSLEVAQVQTSADGTRKLRFVTRDNHSIEGVIIPDGHKTTLCISSQVGCAVDCQFCATAKLGLIRNLDAGEIVDQVYLARELLAQTEPERRITNIVYMGMGEPLHNYDNLIQSLRILTHDKGAKLAQRRVTVSTAGLVPKLERLGHETVRPNLAVSLNAPNDDIRNDLMPINRKWNIGRLIAALKAYPLEQRRRITFEYVLLADVNDSLHHAAQVARLLRELRCKLNLIPWNPHPGAPYRRPAPAVIEAFQAECKRLGLPVYLRVPRGDDIDAACGQLANRLAPTGTSELVALRVARRPLGGLEEK